MVKNKTFHLEDLSYFQIKRCGISKGRLAVNNKAGIIYSKVKKKKASHLEDLSFFQVIIKEKVEKIVYILYRNVFLRKLDT